MSSELEIGHCPFCRAFIGCPADHDRDCDRYVQSDTDQEEQ